MLTPPNTTTVLLDDLLLDAQHELEAMECPDLGRAVGQARMCLVRLCIEKRLSPIHVDAIPDGPAIPLDPTFA